jgi:hypothetical protein
VVFPSRGPLVPAAGLPFRVLAVPAAGFPSRVLAVLAAGFPFRVLAVPAALGVPTPVPVVSAAACPIWKQKAPGLAPARQTETSDKFFVLYKKYIKVY